MTFLSIPQQSPTRLATQSSRLRRLGSPRTTEPDDATTQIPVTQVATTAPVTQVAAVERGFGGIVETDVVKTAEGGLMKVEALRSYMQAGIRETSHRVVHAHGGGQAGGHGRRHGREYRRGSAQLIAISIGILVVIGIVMAVLLAAGGYFSPTTPSDGSLQRQQTIQSKQSDSELQRDATGTSPQSKQTTLQNTPVPQTLSYPAVKRPATTPEALSPEATSPVASPHSSPVSSPAASSPTSPSPAQPSSAQSPPKTWDVPHVSLEGKL